MNFDITILTDKRYVNPSKIDTYTQNVLDEDCFLQEALERLDLNVTRTNWDDPTFDWSTTKYIIFRTTWDYFERFDEFEKWLTEVQQKTKLINPREVIIWNIDKHYLNDLKSAGINIPKTVFIEPGDQRTLAQVANEYEFDKFILKPAVSGGAYNTFMIDSDTILNHESIFASLIANESMILQEYLESITSKGEVSHMVFGGKYSHSILKKAKDGDFRVQDDFGGSVHTYTPSQEEIQFAQNAVKACSPEPVYARVDVVWDNDGQLALGELELIEPELWFRMDTNSADKCAAAIQNYTKLL
jgi:glutathione synthase/RimK-type ligase-like ATP-grasp enzyme